MPLYEYSCQECGQKFELLRSFSQADAQTECPDCHSLEVRRMLSKVNSYSEGRSLNSGHSCGDCASHQCSSCGMN